MIFSGVHFFNWSDKTHAYSPVGNCMQQRVSRALKAMFSLVIWTPTYMVLHIFLHNFTYHTLFALVLLYSYLSNNVSRLLQIRKPVNLYIC